MNQRLSMYGDDYPGLSDILEYSNTIKTERLLSSYHFISMYNIDHPHSLVYLSRNTNVYVNSDGSVECNISKCWTIPLRPNYKWNGHLSRIRICYAKQNLMPLTRIKQKSDIKRISYYRR